MVQNYNEDESKDLIEKKIEETEKKEVNQTEELLKLCPKCNKKTLRRLTTDNKLYSCFNSRCGYAGTGRIRTYEPHLPDLSFDDRKEITLYSEISNNYLKLSWNEDLEQWQFMIYDKNFKSKCELSVNQLVSMWNKFFLVWNKTN